MPGLFAFGGRYVGMTPQAFCVTTIHTKDMYVNAIHMQVMYIQGYAMPLIRYELGDFAEVGTAEHARPQFTGQVCKTQATDLYVTVDKPRGLEWEKHFQLSERPANT